MLPENISMIDCICNTVGRDDDHDRSDENEYRDADDDDDINRDNENGDDDDNRDNDNSDDDDTSYIKIKKTSA